MATREQFTKPHSGWQFEKADLGGDMAKGSQLGAAAGAVTPLIAGPEGLIAEPVSIPMGAAIGTIGGAGYHVMNKFLGKQKKPAAQIPQAPALADEAPPWVKSPPKEVGGNARGVISKSNLGNPQFISAYKKETLGTADYAEDATKKPKDPAVVKSIVFIARGSGRPSVGTESHHLGLMFDNKKK